MERLVAAPLLLYDDRCCVCTTIASAIRRLSRSRIKTLGQYSEEAKILKRELFRPEDRSEEMFWLVAGRTCYGGRNGIVPLLIQILRSQIGSYRFGKVSRKPWTPSSRSATRFTLKCFGVSSYLERFAYTLGRGKVIRRSIPLLQKEL